MPTTADYLSPLKSGLEFRKRIAKLSREEILSIIERQNPELVEEVEHIEWAFANKLAHLTDDNGCSLADRRLTNEELALLVDEPFEEDPQLTAIGMDRNKQYEFHLVKDPVLFARAFLNQEPRAYQIIPLREPNNRKVMRFGRRAGKTFTLAVLLIHYSFMNKSGRCLVMTPMKSQAELLYTEINNIIEASIEVVRNSRTRYVTAPQFVVEFSNNSRVSFFTTGMKSGGKCLTPDHDILTQDGWKPISDATEDELVLAWDNGRYKWQPVLERHEYDFHGDLVVHEGKQLSFRVTPNHKFAVKTRAPGSEWRDVYAENLKDYYIPTSGLNPDLGSGTLYSNEELELWGWWLAEGSGFIGKMARISQIKEDGRKRIVELAEKLGLHYTTPQREIRVQWTPPIYSGTNAYNKFIPRELMGTDNVWALAEGLLGGDGWLRKRGWEYSSSSFQLANDFQELATRNGFRANIREKIIRYTPVDGGVANRHWIVSAYPYKESIINPDLLKREHYEGKVHCITVDSGYFLTRHNGLVHVTGNSDVARGQEAHIIVLDEMDYMGPEDIDAVYAMLQQTSKNQAEKLLIAASTPTGQRSRFWQWCTGRTNDGKLKRRFSEFYFPSYCNPLWTDTLEDEMREFYKPNAYRREIEADWGESAEGVYPRKLVDAAFNYADWKYVADITSATTFYTIGVDWDKYGAGVNIVVMEIFPQGHPEQRFAGRMRIVYREEMPKEQFALLKAVDRVVELNTRFRPTHIYIDRGFGETQLELLHKYGMEHPQTRLHKIVKGWQFSETVEQLDPFTKQPTKKMIKPLMVDNLGTLLEKARILFPTHDDDLYQQLTAYILVKQSESGKPVFEMAGGLPDHAHDALLLAAFAVSHNYDDLFRLKYATSAKSFSNEILTNKQVTNSDNIDYPDEVPTPRSVTRAMTLGSRMRSGGVGGIKRKMF